MRNKTGHGATGDDPEEHPVDTKWYAAEYPEPEVIDLAILRTSGPEDEKQQECHGNWYNRLEEKLFENLTSGHKHASIVYFGFHCKHFLSHSPDC